MVPIHKYTSPAPQEFAAEMIQDPTVDQHIATLEEKTATIPSNITSTLTESQTNESITDIETPSSSTNSIAAAQQTEINQISTQNIATESTRAQKTNNTIPTMLELPGAPIAIIESKRIAPEKAQLVGLEDLESLQGGLLESRLFDANTDLALIAPDPIKKSKIWLNGFISADAMLINTPYDPVYNLPAFNKAAAGFSGGVSVSVQKGPVEFDAGLSYASKGYQPQIIREINGSLEENYVESALTQIIFDMAQANFNVKHHFAKTKKTQFYVMAGSTFNLITYSEYNFEEKSGGKLNIPIMAPASANLLDQKEFEDGALEGGGLLSNSYFSLNAGIGVQYNVNKDLGLFFQPNYQRHILDGGIGPNKDRIHNLSMQIGAKFRINK